MIVNGVDISMLEGWMIKINSNPSFFGKNMNRRWFKVGFVPGPGSEKKLVISYSTSKTAKDPRGWLYVEDVCGIYCRREMIEIVSPSRTLRLKGETSVEHRLWSDSLYKLCNPPPKTAVETSPKAEPRQERRTPRESKKADNEREEDEARERKRRADAERDRERELERERERERERRAADESREKSRSARSNRQRDDSEDDDSDRRRSRDRGSRRSPRDDDDERDSRRHRSPSPRQRSVERRDEQRSSRPHREERASSRYDPRQSARQSHARDGSDDDSSEDDRAESPRPSTNSSTRSLLVAQIKASSFVNEPGAQCKNVMSDSEEEDDYHLIKDNDPEEESPRQPVITSTNGYDDEPTHERVNPRSSEYSAEHEAPSKRKNSDYFDSDNEDTHKVEQPMKNLSVHDARKAPSSNVAADNNFVDDDWDAEDAQPAAPPHKTSHMAAGRGGVAADANFATDDWDD